MTKYLALFLICLLSLSCAPEDLDQATLQEGATAQAFPWTRDLCSSWDDLITEQRIHYCIKSFSDSTNPERTLFTFHGMGGNEKDHCAAFTAKASDFTAIKNIAHIVCTSFGPAWAFHEKGRKEVFERFREYIKETYGPNQSDLPVLYGESMGGFNVVKVSGEKSPEAFQFYKVVAACPAIFSERLPSRFLSKLSPIVGFLLMTEKPLLV